MDRRDLQLPPVLLRRLLLLWLLESTDVVDWRSAILGRNWPSIAVP